MSDPTTAVAYGPDRVDRDGNRNPSDARVVVLGNLDVNDDDPVEVEVLPGVRGSFVGTVGQRIQVRRIQLQYIRRPGDNRRAALAARLAMSSLASRMHPDPGPLRNSDPVAYWDMRTSMDDLRAALCLANGIPVDNISRDGYDLSRPAARRFHAERCARYGAKP